MFCRLGDTFIGIKCVLVHEVKWMEFRRIMEVIFIIFMVLWNVKMVTIFIFTITRGIFRVFIGLLWKRVYFLFIRFSVQHEDQHRKGVFC